MANKYMAVGKNIARATSDILPTSVEALYCLSSIAQKDAPAFDAAVAAARARVLHHKNCGAFSASALARGRAWLQIPFLNIWASFFLFAESRLAQGFFDAAVVPWAARPNALDDISRQSKPDVNLRPLGLTRAALVERNRLFLDGVDGLGRHLPKSGRQPRRAERLPQAPSPWFMRLKAALHCPQA
jgi:hypothetical protein